MPAPPAPATAEPVTDVHGSPPTSANSRSALPMGLSLCGRHEQLLDESARGLAIPRARADDAAHEVAGAVDQVDGRRPEDAVVAPGRFPALVEEHGRRVAPLLDGTAHEIGRLAESDQADFEAASLVAIIERVDGRQLLPARRSPRGPEEEHHHL